MKQAKVVASAPRGKKGMTNIIGNADQINEKTKEGVSSVVTK